MRSRDPERASVEIDAVWWSRVTRSSGIAVRPDANIQISILVSVLLFSPISATWSIISYHLRTKPRKPAPSLKNPPSKMTPTDDVTHMLGLGLESNISTAAIEKVFYYHRNLKNAKNSTPILVLVHGYPQSYVPGACYLFSNVDGNPGTSCKFLLMVVEWKQTPFL